MKWNKFKWFIERLIDFKRKSYPLSSLGTKLIIAGIVLPSPITIAIKMMLPPELIVPGIDLSINEASYLPSALAFITVFIGAAMIHWELKDYARHTARVVISGLPGVSLDFPDEILSKSEQRHAREVVTLSIQDEDIERQIGHYNAELTVDLFKRFVLHQGCKKLYIGGLARVPFLVAYGAFIRNVKKVYFFDKRHRDGSYCLLNDEDEEITINLDQQDLPVPNSNGDVGIALAFSTSIKQDQLPSEIQENALIIQPSSDSQRNLIMNQNNLHQISETLSKAIDQLSAEQSVKRIHLFLSVQSSLAIEVGRRFQEGIHKPWILHNYNGTEYNWCVELSKVGLKLVKH